jgi:uncharacterized protein GlcG (DUF336 family)
MSIVVRQDSISTDAAHAAVKAAVDVAQRSGAAVVAAVVDSGGNLIAFLRASGSFLFSIDIAQDKAFTAATTGTPTATFAGYFTGAPAIGQALALRDRVTLLGGGVPIKVDGKVIGGIGVSGGSEEQDAEWARAGLAAIGVPVAA